MPVCQVPANSENEFNEGEIDFALAQSRDKMIMVREFKKACISRRFSLVQRYNLCFSSDCPGFESRLCRNFSSLNLIFEQY